jgi:hypothetical protein
LAAQPKLVKKAELGLNRIIMGGYYPLQLGTGFFITSDGYLITNYHVIDTSLFTGTYRENLYSAFLHERNLASFQSGLSEAEHVTFLADLKNFFLKANISYRIKLADKTSLDARVISFDKQKDLALLKVQGLKLSPIVPIPISKSKAPELGDEVVAMGFPYATFLEDYVTDFKATTTKGHISALRKDNFGIQHTALLQPGHSGGPLYNMQGELIGINTRGLFPGGLGLPMMALAISVETLVKWLGDNQFQSIIEQNMSSQVPVSMAGHFNPFNKENSLKISPTVFVNPSSPCTVYVNEQQVGLSPLLLKDLIPGEVQIRLESDYGYCEQKYLVTIDQQEVLTLSPPLIPYTGKLVIISLPEGAEVNLDGQVIGVTPFAINEISTEKHGILLKLKGYGSSLKEIQVKRDEIFLLKVNLEQAYPLQFSHPLPSGTIIRLEGQGRENKQALVYKPGDAIWVPAGKWVLTLSNVFYFREPKYIPIDVPLLQNTFDSRIYFFTYLTLSNLKKSSHVFLDGQEVTGQIVGNNLPTLVGEHLLEVMTGSYVDFKQTIYLKDYPETSVQILYKPEISHLSRRMNAVGYPLLSVGLTLIMGSYFLNKDDFLITRTTEYNDYKFYKELTFSGMITGSAFVIAGSILSSLALKQRLDIQRK